MPNAIRKFQYHGADYLSLPAERDAFTTLKDWLSGIAAELELPDKTRKQLLIVADEVFTNIASYGYPDGDGTAKVEVEFNLLERELTLIFSDGGIAYNPLDNESPDVSKPLAERSVGGLGIFMVKKMMNSVEYTRVDDRNILTLKKQLQIQ